MLVVSALLAFSPAIGVGEEEGPDPVAPNEVEQEEDAEELEEFGHR
jgi:hypothetical protein